MALLQLEDVEIGVGGPRPLLEGVDLAIEEGERVCVLGRNGAGKSTLLRLLAGETLPDAGSVRRRRGLRVARLGQEVPADERGSVYDVVAQAVGRVGELLAELHRLGHAAAAGSADILREMGRVQSALEAEGGWAVERRVSEAVSRLGLDPEADFERLSGGMKRRALLARTLAAAPDLLLLDEPTNHLDLENITWLEGFLKGFGGSIVFVTHDRSFLRALATRIAEIDRGRVTSWPGDYDDYLRRREERRNAEEKDHARFDRKLAREEAWIRTGLKARRRRNMGRVRELEQMRRTRAERREQEGVASMEAASAGRSGKRLIEAKHVSFAFEGGPQLVRDLSTTIQRGERVGIAGRNGSGKTTLIRLLLGELAPTEGTVRTGTNMRVAYFDQQRAALDERASVAENLAGGKEFVEVNGRERHVMSYLQDFLFPPERARAPITELSGGERNRLLLARLFSEPSNVLVMDEPTNDLDLETLERLEELVADYAGTLLLVSHDRAFLDRVVTRLLVIEGEGRVEAHVGGYSDWLAKRRASDGREPRSRLHAKKAPEPTARPAGEDTAGPRRLGVRERRELEELPERIEALEARVGELAARLGDPALYRDAGSHPKAVDAERREAQAQLDRAYARWEDLEERSTG